MWLCWFASDIAVDLRLLLYLPPPSHPLAASVPEAGLEIVSIGDDSYYILQYRKSSQLHESRTGSSHYTSPCPFDLRLLNCCPSLSKRLCLLSFFLSWFGARNT